MACHAPQMSGAFNKIHRVALTRQTPGRGHTGDPTAYHKCSLIYIKDGLFKGLH